MEEVYIFGHDNPDTDSVCSAISLAYLKNTLDKNKKYTPKILGKLNPETEFVLDYFKVEKPDYLNDVKIKVKDITYRRSLYLDEHSSIKKVYETLLKEETSGAPIVNSNNELINVVTYQEIAGLLINNELKIDTSFDNIISTLNAKEINKISDHIKGEVELNFNKINKNSIVLINDEDQLLNFKEIPCLIILMKDINIKRYNFKTNIISSNNTLLNILNLLKQSNYIKNYLSDRKIITIRETDYLDHLNEIVKKSEHVNYPVLSSNNKCLGLFKYNEVFKYNKQKVILVDHNEKENSVNGIEDAEILEIIDHHKISGVITKTPINIRMMNVGSTATIIYLMYKEYKVAIPSFIKGLLMSAILSDTVLFESPTSTPLDKLIAEKLSKELKINYKTYANKMFKARSNLSKAKVKDIILEDFKIYELNNKVIGTSDYIISDLEGFKDIEKDVIKVLENLKIEKGYYGIIMTVKDILNKKTYLYYTKSLEDLIKTAFNIKNLKEGYTFDGIMSRKQNVLPRLIDASEG